MLPGRFTGRLFRRLAPWKTVASVREIDYQELRRTGVDSLLFDLDNTLVGRGVREVPDHIDSLLKELKEAGFSICIVSNNWSVRVKDLAAAAGVPLVAPAGKPFTKSLLRAMEMIGGGPSTTVLVGDQMFTDVLGGNLLGVRTVMVEPAGSVELPHTRLLRPLERLIIARLRKADWLDSK